MKNFRNAFKATWCAVLCVGATHFEAICQGTGERELIDGRLKNSEVIKQQMPNGTALRDAKFDQFWKANFDLDCMPASNISSEFNPPALILAAKKCIQGGDLLKAWEMLTAGTDFAYFDLKRLSHQSLKGALPGLLHIAFRDLSDLQRQEMAKVFRGIQSDSEKVGEYCANLARIGPPKYAPTWATLSDIGAYKEPREGDFLANVEQTAIWADVLAKRCKVGPK